MKNNPFALVASMMLSFFVGGSAGALQSEKFEVSLPGEESLIQGLIGKIKSDIKGKRDAHPKDHGCVDGIKVKVKENLGALQVGVFKNPGEEFDAILRSSHGESNAQANDNTPGGHGFGLKILLPENLQQEVADIPGEEYFPDLGVDKKYYKTFDIITISGIHEFMFSTVADYPVFFRAQGLVAKFKNQFATQTLNPSDFGKTAPLVENLKNAVDAGTATPAQVEKVGIAILNDNYFNIPEAGQNPEPGVRVRADELKLTSIFRTVQTHDVLHSSYQSWVPSLLGPDQAVKYQFRPVACEGEAANILKDKALVDSLGIAEDPNRLRTALKARLVQSKNCYELGIHVLEVGHEALVEQSEKAWPGRDNPGAYKTVATLSIPQKLPGQELLPAEMCEALSFNPGHSPLAHKNIGSNQRAREKIYAAIQTERSTQVRAAKAAAAARK